MKRRTFLGAAAAVVGSIGGQVRLDRNVASSRGQRIRTMAQFAEQELVISDGPYPGKLRWNRQPYTKLFVDLVDSGRWNRIVATGPVQSGKTLISSILPILYHLFEMREKVIFGLPDMDMASDKWHEDILPAIAVTRYAEQLPSSGRGSKGGTPDVVRFRNGAALKFMSGHGGDEMRSAYTARVVVITETDKMDTASETSREADPITQLEARTKAFGDRKRIYMECTVSTTEGRTWKEYTGGTATKILIRCPLCSARVSPERDNLIGWKEAESEFTAKAAAAFFCPSCGEVWTEEQRRQANAEAIVIHRGQELTPAGEIIEPPAATYTLGFRWSAVNNLFLSAGDMGLDEWKADRSDDSDNAQKAICQFLWATPHEPESKELNPLSSEALEHRGDCGHKGPCEGQPGPHREPRGVVPEWAFCVTLGIDVGKEWSHWVATAWAKDATSHVIDYGVIENHLAAAGADASILAGLRSFRDDVFATGWAKASGAILVPACLLVDGRYCTNAIYEFARETQRCFPTFGQGAKQPMPEEIYRQFDTKEGSTRDGENYRIRRVRGKNLRAVTVLADPWKAWFHRRLTTEPGKPGAMTFFRPAKPLEHRSFAKHLTAERQLEEFVPGKGWRVYWERVSRNNHWFDAGYLSCVAGHMAGVRLLDKLPESTPPAIEIAPVLARNWGNDRGFDAR